MLTVPLLCVGFDAVSVRTSPSYVRSNESSGFMNWLDLCSEGTQMSRQSRCLCQVQKDTATVTTNWWEAQRTRLRRNLVLITRQAHLLSLLIKRPEVPWPVKLAGGCAIAYLFSPIQLIPTFIPLIGQLDDLFVLFLGTKIVRKFSPAAVLKECEERAEVASSVQVERWILFATCGSAALWQRHHVTKHSCPEIDYRLQRCSNSSRRLQLLLRLQSKAQEH